MTDIITNWFASMVDNAPYLAGAVVAISVLWFELRKCHRATEELAQRLLNHIINGRLPGPK